MAARKTAAEKTAPEKTAQAEQVESTKTSPAEPAQAEAAEPTQGANAEQPIAAYRVIVSCDDTRIAKIVLRDNPAVEDDNIALAVPIGTELKAVEDMGEWTKLTHDLFIMSKFVKKL